MIETQPGSAKQERGASRPIKLISQLQFARKLMRGQNNGLHLQGKMDLSVFLRLFVPSFQCRVAAEGAVTQRWNRDSTEGTDHTQ